MCIKFMKVMEMKLSRRQGRPLSLPNQTSTFPSHSFHFKRHLRGLAKKWRIQLHEVANGFNHKHLLGHVVKGGETLTSILKQYGASVYSLTAANKSIVDVDNVFEGQHLKIPSARKEVQLTKKDTLSTVNLTETHQTSLNIFNGLLGKQNLTMQISHSLPHAYPFYYQAKTTAYFLVLVPLIAFCIRCIIDSFNTRISGKLRLKAVNASKGHHHGSKSMRWKSALRDIMEADNSDSETRPELSDPEEDKTQTSFEDMSHAYGKLENDDEKFLAECGMSQWGYWRGGSPE
ncbi:uncharacterized protein LOC123229295 isoform X1 [Mangifera indica]|uniref:uncharacterized protein LOC123229295 isoform X1 n=1 Tax=Mangifera indica TaxID=29780 RepID=UPI001CF94ADA|nr:uncharacterized protein LOC123229295 isoform X1 [Mangifera indica]